MTPRAAAVEMRRMARYLLDPAMAKRPRPPVDPFASQPRSTRRPGDFNEQAGAQPDPNVEFVPTHSLAGAGDPTGPLRFFQWLNRRKRR